ncbi:MAG: PilN domain-containing protein [Ignavibacteriales bacterium]
MKQKKKQVNKNINFVPDFVIKQRKAVQRMFLVAFATAIFTLTSFGIYYVPELKIFSLQERIDNLDREIEFFKDIQDLYNNLNAAKEKLENKKKIIEEISKNEFDIVPLIDKLTSAVPQGVEITYIGFNDKLEVSVSYIINNPIEANALVDNLNKLNIFEQVDMPTIPIADKKTEISFKLKLRKLKLSSN